MVHVGMTDKNSIKAGKSALGQMVNLTTVKQQVASIRAGPDQQKRIINQSRKEGWYKIAKGEFGFHDNPSNRKK